MFPEITVWLPFIEWEIVPVIKKKIKKDTSNSNGGGILVAGDSTDTCLTLSKALSHALGGEAMQMITLF